MSAQDAHARPRRFASLNQKKSALAHVWTGVGREDETGTKAAESGVGGEARL